jgi:hypothetical protein
LQAAKEAIASKKSLVIDNTNLNKGKSALIGTD